jgi:hypothetical protein
VGVTEGREPDAGRGGEAVEEARTVLARDLFHSSGPGQRVIRPEPSSHQLGGPGQRPALVVTQPQSGQDSLRVAHLGRIQLCTGHRPAPSRPAPPCRRRPVPGARFADLRGTRKRRAFPVADPSSINSAAANRTCLRRVGSCRSQPATIGIPHGPEIAHGAPNGHQSL